MKNSNLLISYQYEHKTGIDEIRLYVTARYQRWLDYSKYHSSLAGIAEEANDILNEVMLSLFSKDFDYLIKLYSTKRNNYTDLDFFVLQMVKLNSHSLTSPYRFKNKPIPADHSVNFQRLKIVDDTDTEDEVDRAGTTLRQFKLVRWVFERLDLTDIERKIFQHAFILHLPQKEFPNVKSSMFYKTVSLIRDAIHIILFQHKLTTIKPKSGKEGKTRIKGLVERFLKSRKLTVKYSEN